MGQHAIKLISEAYTVQEDTTCNRKITSAGKLVVKHQYISCMHDNTKCYWEQPPQQNNIIVPTRMFLWYDSNRDKNIKKLVCNINQSFKSLQRRPIYLTESDNEYILDKINGRVTIKYEIE